MTACEVDSFLDPSVVGRWEHTPTIVPILDRIAAIEDDDGRFVDVSEITTEDLIPEIEDYRIGPGDVLEVRIRDFIGLQTEDPRMVEVDRRGEIELPDLPPVRAQGRTTRQLRDAIVRELSAAGILEDAVVMVRVASPRQATYSVLGSVRGPGKYTIPETDYRLLEALTAAGGLAENVEKLYVIRQIPLADVVRPRPGVPADVPDDPERDPLDPDRLIDLIEELTEPPRDGSPGVVAGSTRSAPARRAAVDDDPPIDLVDPGAGERPRDEAAPRAGASEWVYLDGQWVRVTAQRRVADGQPAEPDRADRPTLRPEDLFTQRVIEIPVKPLLAGAARYNIIIRPGDVIRVPTPLPGLVYVTGNVARPGPYNLPPTPRLTLLRAIDSAGGLDPIGIPERIDLTRMVGENHQATIRLNLRAIAAGTQPDIYLKNNDRINVGTHFFAFPLAVIRSGFRVSYGFGFLLDRNFGNDVFGPPPVRRGGGGVFF